MYDFRVLVKVAKTHELDTLRTLGKIVEENENAFLDVDPKWVAKQDFITAVPVEVSLTMEVRDAIMTNNPNCRFIVTGVPTNRVKTLVERYAYVVAHTEITPEPEKEKECKEALPDTEHYYINGKAVSAEEFNARAEDFLVKMKKFVEDFLA